VQTYSHVFDTTKAFNQQAWILCEFSFQAPGTTTRIAFLSQVTNCCYGPAIDDVSVKITGTDGIYLVAFDAADGRVAIALEDIKMPGSDLDFDDQVIIIETGRPGPCAGKIDGAPCDDSDNCTTGDKCTNQVCAGTPVSCASDDCHPTAGTCDPLSGQCVYNQTLGYSGTTICPLPYPCSEHWCGRYPTRDTCIVKQVRTANDDCCGSSGGHAMWTKFHDGAPNGFGEERWVFEEINAITTGQFTEFPSGYGRLEGTLVGIHDSNNRWKINIEMQYLPDLGSQYRVKNELAYSCQSLQQLWWFYKIRSDVESLLVGEGSNLGLTVVLGLEGTGQYPIQVGPGASMKNSQYGLSTWLTYKEFRYDANWGAKPHLNFLHQPYGNNDGDINVNIECPKHCPPFPQPVCGDGVVNGNEQCDEGPHGGPCCTTTCRYKPVGSVCRLSAGQCDQEEVCTGTSSVCPPDVYAPSTKVCLSGAGFCDLKISTYCTGTAPKCPGVPTIPLRQEQIGWDNFNLISCLDFNAGGGDIEGRAAVKRNWHTTAGFGIGLKTDSTSSGHDRRQDFALVVGHNFTFTDGQVLPDGSGNPNNSPQEDIFVGEVYNGPSYLNLRIRDQSAIIGDKDKYFDAGCLYFKTLSDYFAAQTPNAAASPYYGSGLHIKCDSPIETLYYVQIDGNDLSVSNWWSLSNCNMAAFFVITVTGTGDVVFKGGMFPSVTERVIFNVPGNGRTVHVETGLQGNLLAPGSTFEQANGVTLGLVIVYTVNSFVQANKPNCQLWNPVSITGKVAGPITSVPYPQKKRRSEVVSVIPVLDFGTWALGDQIRIGAESCTIVGGTNVAGAPALLCLPALTGSYNEGTEITGTVKLTDATWVRTPINQNTSYTPSYNDQTIATTISATTASQQTTVSSSNPTGTTAAPSIITDVTGTTSAQTTGSEATSETQATGHSTVRLTGIAESASSSLVACFAMIIASLLMVIF